MDPIIIVHEVIDKILEDAKEKWDKLPDDKKHEIANSLGFDDINEFITTFMETFRIVLLMNLESVNYQDFGFTEQEWFAICSYYRMSMLRETLEIYYSLPKKIRKALEKILSKASSIEEFYSAVLVGPCPKCKSINTRDCEFEPGIHSTTIGYCRDCGTYWCLKCGVILEDPKKECSCWTTVTREFEALIWEEFYVKDKPSSKNIRQFIKNLDTKTIEDLLNLCQQKTSMGLYKYGYAYQDLVNALGEKLGFEVEYGNYRRGPDGIWKDDQILIVVEIKTSPTWLKIEQVDKYVKKKKATFGLVVCLDFSKDQINAVKGGYKRIKLLRTESLCRLANLGSKGKTLLIQYLQDEACTLI